MPFIALENEEIDNLAARFVYESNLIEEVDKAFGTIVIELKNERKTGHVGALLFLERAILLRKRFTERVLKACQARIILEQNLWLGARHGDSFYVPKCGIGNYRKYDIFIGTRRVETKAGNVELAMNNLVSDIRSFITENTRHEYDTRMDWLVKPISDFHYRFEEIHPFIDGNGRAGRLLVWYLMRYFGLRPFVFECGERREKVSEYYDAFRSQEAMRKYFKTRYQQ